MRLFILNGFLTGEVVLALFLMGCGPSLDVARHLEPSGPGFAAALAGEYKAFALYEADQMYDWPDAYHFAAKAVTAASGVAPLPEDPAEWGLPAGMRGQIGAARTRLIGALDAGARRRFSAEAARAQARFDCWVEQQEENWQTEHIRRCRNGFYAALGRIEARFADAFVLFFPFDSAVIAGEGIEALDAVVEAAAAGGPIAIRVDGHADRAGPTGYNRGLSGRRADAVRAALRARGIDAGRIAVHAFGESRPRLATPDGVREPQNRRVEVIVAPAQPL